MKFSVIIPVFQVKKYLSQCIESVLRQTYTNFEIIVVDDGSTDGSEDICDAYASKDKRINVIHQKNRGLSSARNTGIKNAAGDYLIFLDSDDYWSNRRGLEYIEKELKKSPADALFWQNKKVEESFNGFDDSNLENIRCVLCRVPGGLIPYIKSKRLTPCAWNTAVSRKLFQNKDLHFENGVYSEDVEWLARMILKMKSCLFTDLVFSAYRMRDGSITTRVKEKNLSDLNSHYRKISKYIENEKEDYSGVLKVYLGEQAANYILALVLSVPGIWKNHIQCDAFPYIKYCVTTRSKAIKWMKRFLGVSGTVRLIKKVKKIP